MAFSFVLTGGGTGGHVFPALAVGRVLKERGHRLLFVGTELGIEARLVRAAGFEMAFVASGALNRAGLKKQIRTIGHLPGGVLGAWRLLRKFSPQAVFSTGGYAAGPVMISALLAKLPLIVMEPNIIPGFANRKVAGRVYRALVGFPATTAWFPQGKSEVTGLPVRAEFFRVRPKREGVFTVLITGGSQGARTLNRAARESWRLLREKGPIRIIHQTGQAEHEALAREFAYVGLEGEIVPFINDMAEAFSKADLVIARAGAGSVSEIAAARMASILVPFPFAADDHQKKNAEALAETGAARFVLDAEMNGERLAAELESLRSQPGKLQNMREEVGRFAHPHAAERAADVMEEAAERQRA